MSRHTRTSGTEAFAVTDGDLVRRAVPPNGEAYEHRCRRWAFEQIAHAADELGDEGFSIDSLLAYERERGEGDLTFSNVATAIAFLRSRGILDVRRRRNYATSGDVHLDAMTEFHALAQQSAAR